MIFDEWQKYRKKIEKKHKTKQLNFKKRKNAIERKYKIRLTMREIYGEKSWVLGLIKKRGIEWFKKNHPERYKKFSKFN